MSDTQKPVEETPAAAPANETPAATETPAEAPTVEAPKETPAEPEAATATAEETKADAPEVPKEEAKEITPASEGVLGYKAPGLVKGLRFSKRFLYFSEEAIEAKQLSSYRASEKAAIANPVIAWASQTGKGLLFLTKRSEDKATPAGIFSLADVTEITKDGSNEFHFKLNGHKHTFQASSTDERDSWIVALEAKSTEAKADKETVTASEGYKAELEKLTKPVIAVPEKKAAEPEEAKEEEEAAPAEESKEKADTKSRSRSRKRASIFGSLLGKKEEAAEKKEETEESKPAETSTETPAVEASTAPEPVAESSAAPAEQEEVKEDKKEEPEQATPAPAKSKRTSIFGSFFHKVTSPSKEKTEEEATAPAEPAPVASTAPQLDNPVEEAPKPIEPESVTAPAEEEVKKDEAPAETPAVETAATETPASVTKDKRRSSFFNFNKKKGESDAEATEGEAKPKGNKLGGLFRSASKAVKPKSEEPKEEKKEAEPAVEESPEETAKPSENPVVEESKPVNVASTSTPVQAAA